MNLYWADLHNHNEIGYGKGGLERAYRLARGSLDVYAFTPHSWWPDIPDDPQARDYHLRGFERVKENWDRLTELANGANEDGRFAAFIAFEWHSLRWGDYCVYFPGCSGSVRRAASVQELREFVSRNGALMLPHHLAYRRGWRGTDWEAFDETCSPTVEVFSEHGNSLEADSHFGMLRHSMGGSDRGQTAAEQLRGGRRIGFTAGTDDHYGYPGSYGEGLTGVYAESLTRESVFEALRQRHVYAVTGDRIRLSFTLGRNMMGDILPRDTERLLRFEVCGLGPIDYVELVKNGAPAARWTSSAANACAANGPAAEGTSSGGPASAGRADTPRLLRIEWGWDGLSSRRVTRWRIRVNVDRGRILQAIPCFCGGPDVLEEEDSLRRSGEHMVEISSATCRTSFHPTHAAVLALEAGPDTRIRVEATGSWGEQPFHRTLDLLGRELSGGDMHAEILPVFTAPKIKLHTLHDPAFLRAEGEWEDPHPGEDFYYIKVQQKNGHLAWSSPIWCGPGSRHESS
jgi:hypothetical protein